MVEWIMVSTSAFLSKRIPHPGNNKKERMEGWRAGGREGGRKEERKEGGKKEKERGY